MGNSLVFGIFSTRAKAETAVDDMKREGFRNVDISVLFSCNKGTKDFALEKGLEAGATSSAIIDGEIGCLAGIGVLENSGLGRFIAAGPIMVLLSAASAGAVVGGLPGALVRIGIPEDAARSYAGRIEGGCILVSVHADDFKWIRKARNILDQMGADDIILTGETDDYPTTDRPKDRMSA